MFSIYFLLFLFCFENVFGLQKETCAYKDEICLTQAIKQHVYAMFVAGIPGVESSDPLNIDEIIVNLPNCVYKLHEPKLTGFKDCQFQKLKLTDNDSKFDYEVLCPRLILESAYQVNKNDTEEKGKTEINYNNFFIVIKGTYDKVKGDNQKLFIHILDHTIELDLQAGVTYTYKNIANDDKEKPDGYYKTLEELSRQIIMETFLNKFINNLKAFLGEIPIEDMHFRYV